MAHFLKALQIDAVAPLAYRQWLQFDRLPAFMAAVDAVEQQGENRLHWRGTLAGKPVESAFEITAREENALIAWQNPDAPQTHGTLRFEALEEGRTLLTVDIEYAVESPEAKAAEAVGMI